MINYMNISANMRIYFEAHNNCQSSIDSIAYTRTHTPKHTLTHPHTHLDNNQFTTKKYPLDTV